MKRSTLSLGLALVLLISMLSFGAAPQLINFQGILKNGSGNPVTDGSYSVIFTIYDDPAAGNILWAETTSVSTTGGLFTALLGSMNPVPDSAFQDTARYLGVKVGVDPEMTPRQKLTSVGYAYESAQWTSAAQNLFRLNGNVGIGIDAPAARLQTGSVGAEGTPAFIAGTMIAAQATNPDNWTHMAIISGSLGQARLNFGDGFNDDQGSVAYNNNIDAMFFRTATAERMRITSTGNVSIGTTDPQSPFVVQGASNWGLAEVVGNDGFNNEASIGFRTLAQSKGALGTWVLGANNNAGLANAFSLYAADGLGAGSQVISVLPTGNVGIGTNNPVNKLDVEGRVTIGASYSGTNTAPANGLLVQGNVGIGTPSPAAQLHVHDISGTINGTRLMLTQTATGSTIFDGAALICAAPNKAYWWNYENGPSIFGTNNLERVRIDSTGRVGIGTATPTYGLDVENPGTVAGFDRTTNDGNVIEIRQAGTTEGTISVSGTTVSYNAFTGSHYGWSNEVLERGELVRLTGLNRSSHDNPASEVIYGIARSKVPNDPACLGSYLGLQEPGQAAGPENPHLIMAVGNGEMWVVDAGQNIKPGDYLISSDVPGHSMPDDEEKYPVGHILARAAEAVDWESVGETVAGRRHKKISVLYGNFVRGNPGSLTVKLEDLEEIIRHQQKEIEELKNMILKDGSSVMAETKR